MRSPARGPGAGLAILLALVATAAAAPLLTPFDPLAIDTTHVYEPPGPRHPFGTDGLGRDVLARVLYGGRATLGAGAIATALAFGLGALLGTLAGHRGGWLDVLASRAADVVLAFPLLVAALAILGLAPARDPAGQAARIGVVIGAFAWPAIFRLVRAEASRLRTGEAVLAARALGCGELRVAVVHLLPRAVLPALAPAAFVASAAVLTEAGLSFLGLGVRPPAASWGSLLREASEAVTRAWWLAAFPGLFLYLTTVGCQLAGERLRAGLTGRGTAGP
ncbi:MAG: ABC transporter permease [Acidobacteriota bacterium]